jgi:hypothetical protein
MHAKLTDFRTGWYEIAIGLREEEIDILIALLQQLQKGIIHHAQAGGDYEGEGGIGDVTFYLQTNDEDNLTILGPPIHPNR